MTFDASCCWQLMRQLPGEEPMWLSAHERLGYNASYTTCQWSALRHTEARKNDIGNIPGHIWVKLDTKKEVQFHDLRRQIGFRPMWHHALKVIDIIEERMNTDPEYEQDVFKWLDDPEYSTVHLRDNVMEPLRHDPRLVEIGKTFNPTTEWHNTWMPLDTAMSHARMGIDLEDR